MTAFAAGRLKLLNCMHPKNKQLSYSGVEETSILEEKSVSALSASNLLIFKFLFLIQPKTAVEARGPLLLPQTSLKQLPTAAAAANVYV